MTRLAHVPAYADAPVANIGRTIGSELGDYRPVLSLSVIVSSRKLLQSIHLTSRPRLMWWLRWLVFQCKDAAL
jgi:hypothetical protein